MRVLIDRPPYPGFSRISTESPWTPTRDWPCRWIAPAEPVEPPAVTAYRRAFELYESATVRVHVTADERYELFLDGQFVGRGSERGDRQNWFYETYDLSLAAGPHVIVARTWSLGELAPWAQMRVHPGFILSPEGDEAVRLMGTGVADWQAKHLQGYGFLDPAKDTCLGTGVGPGVEIDGVRFPWGFERGEGDSWGRVLALESGNDGFYLLSLEKVHLMKPATLPAMFEAPVGTALVRHVDAAGVSHPPAVIQGGEDLAAGHAAWERLVGRGEPVEIPPGTRRRVVVDLADYYCVYPEVVVSRGRGGLVELTYAEAAFDETGRKGRRDEIDGRRVVGLHDVFRADGGEHRRFDTLWWRCGRYVQVAVEAASEPLVIERLRFLETRYPLEMESSHAGGSEDLDGTLAVSMRTLQMCAHETYMDCPYYEQQQYAGDTRVQCLVTYVTTRDDRLPRKALRMFDASRLNFSGFTTDAYPCRGGKLIPPFSLWWVAMVHDYALWRGDADFVGTLMPGVRAVLDRFLGQLGPDGLVVSPEGWNFLDWTWKGGIPPGGMAGEVNGALNWHLVLVLRLAAELERYVGERELAGRAERLASETASRVDDAFWDEGRGLYTDDLSGGSFSEHAQCLAVLSGALPPQRRARVAEGLFSNGDLVRASIYFSHYLLEACREFGRGDVIGKRLGAWSAALGKDFKTFPEVFEDTRSDCHAWSAHPLYHYFATILGVRPGSMGFGSVRVSPVPGGPGRAKGRLVHPKGDVSVEYEVVGDSFRAEVELPEGLAGVFEHEGIEVALKEGERTVIG